MRSNLASATGATDFETHSVIAGRPLDYGRLVASVMTEFDSRIEVSSHVQAMAATSNADFDFIQRFSIFVGYAGLIAAFATTAALVARLVT